MVTGMPTRWEVAETDVRLSGAIFTLEISTGRCTGVKRVQVKLA
jgi:calcineurin-like phosphoesterase